MKKTALWVVFSLLVACGDKDQQPAGAHNEDAPRPVLVPSVVNNDGREQQDSGYDGCLMRGPQQDEKPGCKQKDRQCPGDRLRYPSRGQGAPGVMQPVEVNVQDIVQAHAAGIKT